MVMNTLNKKAARRSESDDWKLEVQDNWEKKTVSAWEITPTEMGKSYKCTAS